MNAGTQAASQLARLALQALAVLLAVAAVPVASRAAGPPRLVLSAEEVAPGQRFEAKVEGLPPAAFVTWDYDRTRLTLVRVDREAHAAVFAAFQSGPATITPSFGTWRATAGVAVLAHGARPKPPRPAPGGAAPSPNAAKVEALLGKYRRRLEAAGLHDTFTRKDAVAEQAKVRLDGDRSARLIRITEEFFADLRRAGLTLKDLQAFKGDAMAARGGAGSALMPGQGYWDAQHLGTERALMAGRTELVQGAWTETLQDFFKAHPEAVGVVYGRIDIGSWVKNALGGLGFQADIDFSSVSTSPELNEAIKGLFEAKLRARLATDMVSADALLTAHGRATTDVFIGEWGKNFAELDMLKRSSWSLIEPEMKDGGLVLGPDGNPVIRERRMKGADLFWERAFRSGTEVEFPRMDLSREPMLSLEMLRHGIHDVEEGPFRRGQKIVKMLKYVERSYFMNRKALAGSGWNPYAENDPVLAETADRVIKSKDKPEVVEELIRALAGEDVDAGTVDRVVDTLTARAKVAMQNNADRALAFRLHRIAAIGDLEARQGEVERLWTDLDAELTAFAGTGVDAPPVTEQARDLARDLLDGKLAVEELEARAKQLDGLLRDAYRLEPTVVERVMLWDPFLRLRAYLRKRLAWKDEQVARFVEAARQKYPRAGKLYDAVVELNGQLERTTAGSKLLGAADFADNAFFVYDAYLAAGGETEGLRAAALAMGRVGLQQRFPSLQIPLAVYDSFRDGSPAPVGMAVAFTYFPFAGQLFMVGSQLQRLDVAVRDTEFYGALDKMLVVTEFDGGGRIVRFVLRNRIGGAVLDEADIAPPGDRDRIAAVFDDPESPFYVSSNFRYFTSLVPNEDDRFGRYDDKLAKLKRFFPQSEELRYAVVMLESYKAKGDGLPKDAYTGARQEALRGMEESIRRAIWVAMADALESAYASSGKRGELEARIRKIEEDLSLGDDDLGKGKGLLSRIAWEIRQNSGLLSGENVYAAGLIFERYIRAYDDIARFRTAVLLELWNREFGVDYVAAQSDPMQILLAGPRSGAPRLGGDPQADYALAEGCLAAHRRRGAVIRRDLAGALGRPADATRDAAHLKALGQLGFEWEHLLDDCGERRAAGCAEAQGKALATRSRAYRDYLARLRTPGIVLEVRGPAQAQVGREVRFEAVTKAGNAAGEEALRRALTVWKVDGDARFAGTIFASAFPRAGTYEVTAELVRETKGKRETLASQARRITVQGPAAAVAPATVPSAGGGAPGTVAPRGAGGEGGARKAPAGDGGASPPDARPGDATGWKLVEAAPTQPQSLETAQGPVSWTETSATIGLKKSGWTFSFSWPRPPETLAAGARHRIPIRWSTGGSGGVSDEPFFVARPPGVKSGIPRWGEGSKSLTWRKGESGGLYAGFGCFTDWATDPGNPQRAVLTLVFGMFQETGVTWDTTEPESFHLRFTSRYVYEFTGGGGGPLKVALQAPSTSVLTGEEVSVKTGAGGGSPPYRHAWEGPHSGTGAEVLFASATPGDFPLSVTVTDAAGGKAAATVTLRVEKPVVKVAVAGLEKGRIVVGGTARVTASVLAGSAPAGGPFEFQWQPNPEVTFDPPQGTAGATIATFRRPGPVALRATVLRERDGATRTVAESDEVEVDVVPPRFRMVFTPASPYVGQDVTARVEVDPEVGPEHLDLRWIPLPANAVQHSESQDARDVGFRLRDGRPARLQVIARTPFFGDALGGVGAALTAKLHDVRVSGPRMRGPAPRTWKEGPKGGLVDAARSVRVHEAVSFRVEVSPPPFRPPATYAWTAAEGCRIGNPSSQEPQVTCGLAGTHALSVTVRDADGAVLGSGAASLTVAAPAGAAK